MRVIIELECIRCIQKMSLCSWGACRFDPQCCKVCPEQGSCMEEKICRLCKGKSGSSAGVLAAKMKNI